MIRQICLSCYKTVELPDDTAGKDTPCPSCGKVIAVPAKYAPGVAEGGGLTTSPPPLPPLPPPIVPPTPSPGPKPGATPMSADPSAPPGLKTDPTLPPPPPTPPAGALTGGVGLALDPRWLDWVPVGCLLLAVILTFLPWAEMKLGGYSVMTQNGWEALFAGKGDNTPRGKDAREWEELDKALAGKSEKDTVGTLRSDWLLLPYLMLLFALVVLFAAERVVRDPATFPPTAKMAFLPPIWRWRLAALGGLAVLAFLILWFQAFQGFGLQKSIHNMAVKEKLADNPTDTEKREYWIRAGQISGMFPVHQTLWLNLLLTLHAVAVIATAARFWLDSRGAKPHPRLDARW